MIDVRERPQKGRHIAVAADGQVGVGMQWQGALLDAPPLVATHRMGGRWMEHGDGQSLDGYVGSVAFDKHSALLAVTSPRAGLCQVFDPRESQPQTTLAAPDACGLAMTQAGLWMTTGHGHVAILTDDARSAAKIDVQFDNHLVPV